MTQSQSVFRKNKSLFYEYITPVSSKSVNYIGIEGDLDSLLLLADRILAACQEDLEFNRVLNIKEYLINLANGDKQTKIAEDILEDVELWLRVILSLVNPAIWQLRRLDPHYSLAHLVREDLDLLSQVEASLKMLMITTKLMTQ